MLKIRSIALTDFGPFKGEQRIEFPGGDGVSIIYGENMRGKTTLLNAIRFALFGKVIARGNTQRYLHQIGNWETVKEKGKYGFKVVLEFENEGCKYQLTREHKPRAASPRPQTDIDYQQEIYLRKDGTVLGPDARNSELARIMPEAGVAFFSFRRRAFAAIRRVAPQRERYGAQHQGCDRTDTRRSRPHQRPRGSQRTLQRSAEAGIQGGAEEPEDPDARQPARGATQAAGRESGRNRTRLKKDLDGAPDGQSLPKRKCFASTEKTKALLDERKRLQDEITNSEAGSRREREETKGAFDRRLEGAPE